MSGSLNRVTLIGHLGRDPESKSFQNGGKVVNLSIATSESWKDKNSGERKEKTEWHNVAIFNEGLASVAEKYLRKGSKVYLEGKLQTRKWQDQSGADRYSTEIVLQGFDGTLILLGDKQGDGGGYEPRQSATGSVREQGGGAGGFRAPAGGDLEDDVPFMSGSGSW